MGTNLRVQVIDFFSGCGGTSCGFVRARTRRVKFDLRGAVDINAHANATYKRMLGLDPIRQDVRTLLEKGELRRLLKPWGLDRHDPLLIIGCAPCQGFTSHKKKDRRNDARNGLLEVFGEIVCKIRPDLVVMENVPEMLCARHWRHYARWRDLLRAKGYSIRAKIYNLAQFGVPQERFRALVLASRDWKYFRMPKPTHQPDQFLTVRDAISHLPPLEAGGVDASDPMHITSRHRRETVELLRLIPQDGGSRRSLPEGVGPRCLRDVDGFRDVYGRLWWDKPAIALTGKCRTPSAGRYAHPEQHRGLSVREAALLQGFPADYYFEGPFDDKFQQIGNAVSPPFAQAIAKHLNREWHADHDDPEVVDDYSGDIEEPIAKSFSSAIAGMKKRLRETGRFLVS